MKTKRLPGEITHKAFCVDEAERRGVSPHAIQMRIMRGHYPQLKIRKVNRSVVYVKDMSLHNSDSHNKT